LRALKKYENDFFGNEPYILHKYVIFVKNVTLEVVNYFLCLPDLQEFLAKHDHAGMPMKIYKMTSFTKQITVEVIQSRR
jgi:hypothetical protein